MSTKEEIIDLLRERMEDLCAHVLPGGKRVGHEWLCGSINGESGKSMHVELRGPKAGMWKDHAGDDGGDVLKLVQMSQGLPGFKEAMDWSREFLGLPAWAPDPNSKPPFDPLRFSFRGVYGNKAYAYRDINGNVIGYVVRGDEPFGKGIPLRLIDGEWKWAGWKGDEPKPIYGIEQLKRRPNASLLIVEGEKTKEAARTQFPDRVVLSWLGGSGAVQKADWQPVIDHILANKETKDFSTVLWEDADLPGRKAMRYLKTLLPGDVFRVNTTELPEKWDLADAPPEGVDVQAMLDAALYDIPPPKEKKIKKAAAEESLAAEKPTMRGDIQMPDVMELPEGVLWDGENGVQYDVDEHSLFFHKNVLYSKRTQTDHRTGDIFKIWFHPIANFHIQILQILEDEKESQYLLRITNVKNRTRTFHTSTDMLLTSGNLKKALLGKGDFRYTGNEREADFERLVKKLLNDMGDGQKIDVLGWQHDTRVYAMNDALITTQPDPQNPSRALVLRYDEFGSTTIDSKHYYVPSANKIFARSPYKYLPQKRFKYVESGVTFAQLGKLIVEVHREHGMIALVFVVAALFSSKIFAHHGFFPMGCLYGEASTGKSKLTQCLQHFFGDRQEAMQITGKSTDKAKIRKFAQLIDGLVVLEEFSNSIGDNGFQWLKGLNDRNGYERGTIDSNFGTDNVPITSAVILTGNDYPSNDALLTRLVVIEMMKNTFTPKEQAKFGELTDLMERGYSCVISELMVHRDQFEEEYKKWYKTALADMTSVLTMSGVTLERMVQNPSILMAVYMFFEKRIEWPMSRVDLTRALTEAMVQQNNNRDTGGEVAKWWSCFLAGVKEEQLFHGEDYKIDADHLYIRFSDCHEKYLQFHPKLHGTRGHVISTMRTKLEKSQAYIEQVKGTRFGKMVTSAYVFSLTKLGEDFIQSLIMKRSSKYRRNGGPPPPVDGGGTNGHEPPNGPSGAPVSEEELDLVFGGGK